MFDWYNIFNLAKFESTNLISRKLDAYLEGHGAETILIVRGISTSVVFRDKILPIEYADRNPNIDGDYAVYKDAQGEIWLGIKVVS